MQSNKAQSALEFLILISVVIFFFAIFFLTLNENMSDKVKERKNLMINQIANSIKDEINLASESSDGYNRVFSVPMMINGENYEINIIDNVVYLKTTDNKFAMAISVPKVNGNLTKGNNLIKKSRGQILLNPS